MCINTCVHAPICGFMHLENAIIVTDDSLLLLMIYYCY